MSASYPIAVIGPGALGLSFAGRLARHMPVAVIARSRSRAGELRAGVALGGERYLPEAFGPDDAPRADWVLVMVKANDTSAAATIAARMSPIGVLSLQNGWVQGALREPFAEEALVAQGVTTEGAFRLGS